MLRELAVKSVEDQLPDLLRIKESLYLNPEVGGEEAKSSALLIDYLRGHGFTITENLENIDYCFKAVYDSGREGVSIGLTAEYDALPEIGHGCGHNIIATAPTGAAVAMKALVDELGGKVILYGTPAEECFVRKCDLARAGVFKEIDFCLTIHPNPVNLSSGKTTAIEAIQVDFYGKSAHAGAHPEDGINALDAGVYYYQKVRDFAKRNPEINIHGIMEDTGVKCSVIPDHTAVKFLIRTYSMEDMERSIEAMEKAAKEAAETVSADYKLWHNEPGNKDIVNNETLSQIFNEIYESLGGGKMPKGPTGASTDVGDVSHEVPTIMPWIGIGCPDVNLHTRGFAEATMTKAGDKAMELSAKAMALTALRVVSDKEVFQKMMEEFRDL